MTNAGEFELVIDDRPIGRVRRYEDGQVCMYCGADETSQPSDPVRSFTPTGMRIFIVEAYQEQSGKTVWGIRGAFRRGEWDTSEQGDVVLRVWDRLA